MLTSEYLHYFYRPFKVNLHQAQLLLCHTHLPLGLGYGQEEAKQQIPTVLLSGYNIYVNKAIEYAFREEEIVLQLLIDFLIEWFYPYTVA